MKVKLIDMRYMDIPRCPFCGGIFQFESYLDNENKELIHYPEDKKKCILEDINKCIKVNNNEKEIVKLLKTRMDAFGLQALLEKKYDYPEALEILKSIKKDQSTNIVIKIRIRQNILRYLQVS